MTRDVRRSENLGVPVVMVGHNLSPLVEIGLTDLPNFGCAMAHPGTTALVCKDIFIIPEIKAESHGLRTPNEGIS